MEEGMGFLSNQVQRDSKASLYLQSPFGLPGKWDLITEGERNAPLVGQGRLRKWLDWE